MKKMILAATALFLLSGPALAETYRLMHAIGNEETEVARDLTKADCDARKLDRKALAEALGVHSERLGEGSITCLPESAFDD